MTDSKTPHVFECGSRPGVCIPAKASILGGTLGFAGNVSRTNRQPCMSVAM